MWKIFKKKKTIKSFKNLKNPKIRQFPLLLKIDSEIVEITEVNDGTCQRHGRGRKIISKLKYQVSQLFTALGVTEV